MEDILVSVMKNIDILAYPESPFHPPEIFPEFSSFEVYPFELNPENHVYSTVRTVLSQLALDPEHVGTSAWNPLKSLVMPHNHIVIKPNLVFDTHPLGVKGFEALVTHASITRVIIDYILLATRGKCTITICDVPLQTANWQNLIKQSQYLHLVSFYAQHGIHIQLLDLRYEISQKNRAGVVTHREKRIRDPLGYTLVDLQKRSYLYEIRHDAKKLEITDYGRYTVSRHHYDSKNE